MAKYATEAEEEGGKIVRNNRGNTQVRGEGENAEGEVEGERG